MTPPWIIEPIDILEYRSFGLPSGFPSVPPDQLCLEGIEKRLNHSIVITIALAAHRDLEAVRGQTSLIVVRTVLRSLDALLSVKRRSETDLSVCVFAQ